MGSELLPLFECVLILLFGLAAGYTIGVKRGVSKGLRMAKQPPSPHVWILFLVGSGMALLGALAATIYSIYFIASSVPTQANVVELVESRDQDGVLHLTTVYTYRTPEGDPGDHITDRTSDSDGRRFKAGDLIPIRYLKDSPGESRIDYFSHHWMLPITMVFLSIALGATGWAMRSWYFRRLQMIMTHQPPS